MAEAEFNYNSRQNITKMRTERLKERIRRLTGQDKKIAEALAGSEMVIEGALLPCVTPWGEKATSPRWHRKH